MTKMNWTRVKQEQMMRHNDYIYESKKKLRPVPCKMFDQNGLRCRKLSKRDHIMCESHLERKINSKEIQL